MAKLLKELNEIKKKYGEKFMHICRDNFSTLLEKEGLLSKILDKYFASNSKSIGEDIINNYRLTEFKDFIYSKIDVEKKEIKIIEDKTPYQILDEVGYKLIECKTEKKIKEFRKYYAPNELICTIKNGGRLNSSVVFFAVKKDAEDIKRKDFKKPQREDEYGTSVLGIQFDRYGTCTPHIITRYNDTVNNPNSTYGNDLDKIAPGLTESFARLLQERGLKLNKTNIEKFELNGYTVASDGKYYKYNMEVNGVYYCPGNIIIGNGEVKKLEKPESQILIDCFILDIEKKTLKLYDDSLQDSFLDGFENIEKIKVEKSKDKEKQTRIIIIQIKDSNIPIRIEIDKNNNIVGYENKELTQIGDSFLYYNEQLSEVNLPELTEIGDNFLWYNNQLSELNFPKLKKVGNDFLSHNKQLSKLNLPALKEVRDGFIWDNDLLSEVNFPELKKVGDNFLYYNEQLTKLYLPKLTEVGNSFLYNNDQLTELNLPELTEVGDGFLKYNKQLSKLNLPQLKKVDKEFLNRNIKVRELNLPKLTEAGDGFLCYNSQLSELNLPQLKKVRNEFLRDNEQLVKLSLPCLIEVGDSFLCHDSQLSELNLPQLKKVRNKFLYGNEQLVKLSLPCLTEVGDNFLYFNEILGKLSLPCLTEVGNEFLFFNRHLTEINLPQLTEVGDDFLWHNEQLSELNLPQIKKVGNRFLNLHPRKEEMIADMYEKNAKNSEITHINPEEIAELDRKTKLTTEEVNLGKKLLKKNIYKDEILGSD